MARKKQQPDETQSGGAAVADAPAGAASATNEGVQTSADVTNAPEPVELLPLDRVFPSPANPRQFFDPAKMASLRASLERNKQLQPILVKPADADGKYEILDGERRWRCFKELGWLWIEARVRAGVNLVEDLILRLAGNRDHAELSPVEEARAYAQLREHLSAAEIAARLGVSERHVYARLELLDLEPRVLEAVDLGTIAPGHAQLLSVLPWPRQVLAFAACGAGELSVRGLRDWIAAQGWARSAEAASDAADAANAENGGGAETGDVPTGNADRIAGFGAKECEAQDAQDARGSDGADGADAIGEAQADLERQQSAPARAEAAAAERKADETPDAAQQRSQQDTENTRLYEATTLALARKLARAFKPNEVRKQLTEHLVNEFRELPGAVRLNAIRCGLPELPDVAQYKTQADLLVSLRAICLGRLLLTESHARIRSLAQAHNIDHQECQEEAEAEMLGVSVDVLRQQRVKRATGIQVSVRDAGGTYTARANGKTASSTAGEASAVAALARKFGLTSEQIEAGGVEEDRLGAWWIYPPQRTKPARADKGKARKSAKVTGAAIRAAVKAAGKGRKKAKR